MRWTPVIIIAALVVLTTMAYAPVFRADFINYDDPEYVTDNVLVRIGLRWYTIVWAFGTDKAANWHPLTWLSHMLDSDLFGDKATGPHLVNLGLHVANVILLFRLVARWTGSLPAGAVAAALFAVHPVNVESVAWVSQRKSVLSLFFGLLTLESYTRYGEGRGARWYLLALLWLALGLLCKPMLVTLPFLFLLLDLWPLRRWKVDVGEERHWQIGRILTEKIPFVTLSVVSSYVTYLAQEQARTDFTVLSLEKRIGNAIAAIGDYAIMLVAPARLAVFYPHPLDGLSSAKIAWGSAVIVILLAVAVVAGRRRPYLTVGVLWFLGALVPMIGFVQVGRQAYADRYLYLPAIGLFVALAAAAESPLFRRIWVGATTFGVVTLALASLTFLQARRWQDSDSLFTHTLAVTKNNAIANYMLGVEKGRQGDNEEALRLLRRSLEITPNDPRAHVALATFFVNSGKLKEALKEYDRALELAPNTPNFLFRRGVAKVLSGDTSGGNQDLERALQLEPENSLIRNELAILLASERRFDDATHHFRLVLKSEPNNYDARNGMGSMHAQRGRYTDAREEFEKAIEINPAKPSARANLGLLLLREGKKDEAIALLKEVVSNNPNFVEGYTNLASAHLANNDSAAALTVLRDGVAKNPNAAGLQKQLIDGLVKEKRIGEAESELQAIIARRPDDLAAKRALARIYFDRDQYDGALPLFREIMTKAPDDLETANNLAWFLAVHPNQDVRSPAEAVSLAERVFREETSQKPTTLDTLAAAYASAGRYDDAVAMAKLGIELAGNIGDQAEQEKIKRRLDLYARGQPFRLAGPR